jgi:hypothetical protein
MVAEESVEILGVVGQYVGSYQPQESGNRPSVALYDHELQDKPALS